LNSDPPWVIRECSNMHYKMRPTLVVAYKAVSPVSDDLVNSLGGWY